MAEYLNIWTNDDGDAEHEWAEPEYATHVAVPVDEYHQLIADRERRTPASSVFLRRAHVCAFDHYRIDPVCYPDSTHVAYPLADPGSVPG